jgi:hypothetical protein
MITQAKAQFKRRSTANNVSIIIPVPDDADSPRFRTNIGTVHYAPETSSIVWKIKQFGGGKEFLMRAELGLPSVRGDDDKGGGMMGGFGGSMGGVGAGKGKRPIQVKFEIPYFTTSGIQVRYLKIIEPKVCSFHHMIPLIIRSPWLSHCPSHDLIPNHPFLFHFSSVVFEWLGVLRTVLNSPACHAHSCMHLSCMKTCFAFKHLPN